MGLVFPWAPSVLYHRSSAYMRISGWNLLINFSFITEPKKTTSWLHWNLPLPCSSTFNIIKSTTLTTNMSGVSDITVPRKHNGNKSQILTSHQGWCSLIHWAQDTFKVINNTKCLGKSKHLSKTFSKTYREGTSYPRAPGAVPKLLAFIDLQASCSFTPKYFSIC